MLTIHYHRYDGNYDGIALWTWDRTGQQNPSEQDLEPVRWDDYGACFELNPDEYGINRHWHEIGFVARLHKDWNHKDGEDRYWSPDMGHAIWLVGGDPDIYTERPDTSPQVQAAYVDSPRLLTIRLSHGIELGRLVPRSFQIRSGSGTTFHVTTVRALDAHAGKARLLEVYTEEPLDLRFRVVVQVEGYRPSNALPRNILFDREKYYCDMELGAIHAPEATTFRVFAPSAESVEVLLYSSATATQPHASHAMNPIGSGVWEVRVPGDLHERHYRFGVRCDGELGGRRDVVDIHARSLTGHDGHGIVLDLRKTDPAGFRPVQRPATIEAHTDAVIVEYSVRDFTRDQTSGVPSTERGKYLGFARRGTTVPGTTIKTGIDHLVELGVTHVQILPIHDFDNREDSDEYNWGYMTANFSSPDGWYSSNHRTSCRVAELKTMIKALHDAGIRVIMDVVYNHTSPTSTFEAIAPRYYHRRREDGRLWNGSGCGNEFHSEAPMARKFIVDSCLYWVREYGVDGFRFDLMGLVDIATMQEIRSRLQQIDPTLLLYGEPWAATGPEGTGIGRVTYKDVVAGTGIGAFNDQFRNALKGSPDGDESGYVQNGSARDGVKKGIQGSIHDWARQPYEAIQYATCHDNLCLFDKLELSAPEADEPVRLQMQCLTNGVLAISQGIMFLHGGEEFARTKHGNHNSYNAADSINAVNWLRKKKYQFVFDYTRAMIALRRAHPVFRLRTREEIERRLSFRDDWCPTPHCIAVRLDGHDLPGETWKEVLVFINPEAKDLEFPLPAGNWNVHAQGVLASVEAKLLTVCDRVPVMSRSLLVVARS